MPIKAIKLRAGFLLLLFTLIFLSSNFLVTEVNAETLEESFKVTPLPFWDISTYGTDISFIKNSILVNGSHEIHEDSIEFFSETTPNDYWYYPDPISFQSYSGNGCGNGANSGTHSNTHSDDISYYSRTGMSGSPFMIGGIFIDIENVPYQYLKYQIHLNAVVRVYRTSGSGTCDAVLGMYDADSAFPTRAKIIKEYNGITDTGYDTIDETFSLTDVSGFASGIMRFGIDVFAGSTGTWQIDLDYLFIEIVAQYGYQESFADISDWIESGFTAGDSTSTDNDVAIFTSNHDAGSVNDYWYSNTPSIIVPDFYYAELRFKITTTLADVNIYWSVFTEDDRSGDIQSSPLRLEGFAISIGVWYTYKFIITLSNIECVGFHSRTYGNVRGIYFDYLRIGPSNEHGYQHDCSTLVSIGAGTDSTITTDGDSLNITGTGAGDGWFYLTLDPSTTATRIEETYYLSLEIKILEVYNDIPDDNKVGLPRLYADGGSQYVPFATWFDESGIIRMNWKASTSDAYSLRFYVDNDDWFTVDYIQFYSIADYAITQSAGCTSLDIFYVDENNKLVIDKDTVNYMMFAFQPTFSISVIAYPTWNITLSTFSAANYIQYYVGGSWETHYWSNGHGLFTGTGLFTTFQMVVYYDEIVTNIEFWPYHEFEIKIPIDQFKNHKFQWMINTDNISSGTLDFSIYHNLFPSNWNFQLDFDTDFFIQRDYELNISNYDFLRFKADLKYSINSYDIDILDVNKSKIGENLLHHDIIKTGNTFSISTENFTGSFYLYYFTGNIDYTSEWNRDKTNEDIEVYQTDYSATLATSTGTLTHSSTRNLFVTGFQFWRSELILAFDLAGYSAGDILQINQNATFEFYYPNGTLQYLIDVHIRKYLNYDGPPASGYAGHIKVFHYENEIETQVYDSPHGFHMSSTLEGIFSDKFAIWRTQENYLGIKYKGDRWKVPDDNFTIWISEHRLENFQCNITHSFLIEYNGFTYVDISIIFDALEYSYEQNLGVSEPHFSTTWWNSIPIIGPIINAFILVGNAIALAIEAGLLPIALIISAVSDTIISALTSAIGDIAGSVWTLFEAALDSLGVSIDAIAADIWGFFDGVLDSIAGVIDDIYSTIGDVYTAIADISTNLIASIGMGITNALVPAIVAGISSIIDAMFALWEIELNIAGNALGWGDIGTFIFDVVDSTVLVVPSWLALIVNLGTWMINTVTYANFLITEYGPMLYYYGLLFIMVDIVTAIMTMDADKIRECATRYLNVLEKVAGFMFKLISLVLNAIWGILPF